MYRVTIEADTTELVLLKMQKFMQDYQWYSAPAPVQETAPAALTAETAAQEVVWPSVGKKNPVQEAPMLTATECLESQKKPVGRPRKLAEPVAEAPAPKPEPAPAPKAEKPKKYTLDQVRSALQTYAQKVDPDASVGILKVRELLAQFQSTKHVPCQKISEVQDQDYAALVAACGT